jgi:chromosome segregation ATPase
MGILIFISAAIAIGVLIVIVWTTDRELREKSRRLQMAETRLAAASGEAGAVLSTGSASESEKIADLERRLSSLTGERTRLVAEVENLRESLQRHGMRQNSEEAEGALTHLRSENTELHTRIQTLEEKLDGREDHGALLKGEQAKVSELEQQMSNFREERAQLLSQVENLEQERQASQARIQELEASQSTVSNLERNLAQLRDENSKISAELSDFKKSLQEKIQTQIVGLQALYGDIESRRH